MTKHLYAINTANAQGLSSTTHCQMSEYEESAHPMHVWIKTNYSTHDMTKEKNERMETEWF